MDHTLGDLYETILERLFYAIIQQFLQLGFRRFRKLLRNSDVGMKMGPYYLPGIGLYVCNLETKTQDTCFQEVYRPLGK